MFIRYSGQDSPSHEVKCMDVLFVRWFGWEPGHRSGFSAHCLPRIGFLPEDDPDAFGFLDPNIVVYGVHLIPAFSLGKTEELLGRSFARHANDDDKDW